MKKGRWLEELDSGREYASDSVAPRPFRSARIFYEESSSTDGSTANATFSFKATDCGDISLLAAFDKEFFSVENSVSGTQQWLSHPGLTHYLAREAMIRFPATALMADTYVFVVKANSADATKRVWPHASLNTMPIPMPGPFWPSKSWIYMPFEWDRGAFPSSDGQQIHPTFAHELGHTLGLLDQYGRTASENSRKPEGWDLMDLDTNLPYFSLLHRLSFGWVDPAQIVAFNPALLSPGGSIDSTFTLRPAGRGGPAGTPTTAAAGAEFRIASGRNYYFEYRKKQTGQIGDNWLNPDGAVLGTDTLSYSMTLDIGAPRRVRLLPPNCEGAALRPPGTYCEPDITDPSFPSFFVLDYVSESSSPDAASVRVRYGNINRPDPMVRPWSAAPHRPFQSPSIEVKNGRNAPVTSGDTTAPADWFNVPWAGNPNDVIVTVQNQGDSNAPGVTVDLFVKDFSLSSAKEVPLGTVTRDVPAFGSTAFVFSWLPSACIGTEAHFCIIAKVRPYTIPGSAVTELSGSNNLAQSNYTRFISASASPPSRRQVRLLVKNPYQEPAVVRIDPVQTNPLYRTYLEHAWITLGPFEERYVTAMSEFAKDEFLAAGYPDAVTRVEKFEFVDNRLAFTGVVTAPYPFKAPLEETPLGGADVIVAHGWKTYFHDFSVKWDGTKVDVFGDVRRSSDGTATPSGNIILTLTDSLTGEVSNTHLVMTGGKFSTTVGTAGWTSVRAYYQPADRYADVTSIERPNPAL